MSSDEHTIATGTSLIRLDRIDVNYISVLPVNDSICHDSDCSTCKETGCNVDSRQLIEIQITINRDTDYKPASQCNGKAIPWKLSREKKIWYNRYISSTSNRSQ